MRISQEPAIPARGFAGYPRLRRLVHVAARGRIDNTPGRAEGVIGAAGTEEDPLIIGGTIFLGEAVSNHPFMGEIDEVEIFCGQALTLGQITAIGAARPHGHAVVTWGAPVEVVP